MTETIFDPLVNIIHSNSMDTWKDRNLRALEALFGTRYPKRAEKSVILRAPDMKGSESGVPYAAYIHPDNKDAGAYGGMSFVIFPTEGAPCLFGMVIGTQGLAPDEGILGRPGHTRKLQAISRWLNHTYGSGEQISWS
jgi:5-methylcytosine-specific restriction protein B